MTDKDKISLILDKVKLTRKELKCDGNMAMGINLTLNLIVDYIEFMLTPCEDDD